MLTYVSVCLLNIEFYYTIRSLICSKGRLSAKIGSCRNTRATIFLSKESSDYLYTTGHTSNKRKDFKLPSIGDIIRSREKSPAPESEAEASEGTCRKPGYLAGIKKSAYATANNIGGSPRIRKEMVVYVESRP